MGKTKATNPAKDPQGFGGWDTSDKEFDRQLLVRFPIGAHLPLSNTAYDLIKEKRKFLSEKTGNDIDKIRTEIPIQTLTVQEKQNMERAPIVFPKDRFKGSQATINAKLGQKINQVARKTGTIAKKIKKQVFLGRSLKFWKTAQSLIIHHTPLEFGRTASNHGLEDTMVSLLGRTHGSTESAAQQHLKTLLLINTNPEQNLVFQ